MDSMTPPAGDVDLSDPSQRETIHFETLWTRARDTVIDYAAHHWTDYGEHDPGVTLLQAVTYGVADLAYRHTHPLVDLLTTPGQPIFEQEFGPAWALGCTPITADDYRRAILDLYDEERQQFYFRNVHWSKEASTEYYTYWYNPASRQFQFSEHDQAHEQAEPATDGISESQQLYLLGGYHVWVEPQRGIDRERAQAALNTFLVEHRNLGEQVRAIDWLQPQEMTVVIEAELDDDCQAPARVMAEVFAQLDAWLRPRAQRASAQALREQGVAAETIYEGPRLVNGAIVSLPPERDPAQAVTLDLRGLPPRLLAIDGLARLRALRWADETGHTDPWVRTLKPQSYPLVYGETPEDTLSAPASPVKLYKRGQRLMPSAQDIAQHIPREPRYSEAPHGEVAGQSRALDAPIAVAPWLPPCYGLHDAVAEPDNPENQQARLRAYLQPFEQWLTDGAQQLGALPTILGFARGQQAVGLGYFQSEERELAIIDYLMGYFGSARAPRVFASDDFVRTQQGSLTEWAQLGYQRANVRIDQVSALVKRIAARLGIGAELFATQPDLSQLPIYLIEYRALLPEVPNPGFVNATPTDAILTDTTLTLYFADTVPHDLPRAGQMIRLDVGGDRPFKVKWALVTHADQPTRSLTLDLSQNSVLRGKASRVKENLDTVRCNGCQIWLHDMDYPLVYASNQSGLKANEKRLFVSLSVNAFKVGESLTFEPGAVSRSVAPRDDTWTGTVTEVDVANGWLVVDSGDHAWPQDTYAMHWYRKRKTMPDLFSFKVGLVLDRSRWLKAIEVEPAEVIRWVEQIVRDEMPAQVDTQIHWLDGAEFSEFAVNYAAWQAQASDARLGEKTYALLRQLALGCLPDSERIGIGAAHVIGVNELKDSHLIDPESQRWTTEEMVRSAEVLYVPLPADGVDVLHVASDDEMADTDLLDPATQAWHDLARVQAAQVVYVPRSDPPGQAPEADARLSKT